MMSSNSSSNSSSSIRRISLTSKIMPFNKFTNSAEKSKRKDQNAQPTLTPLRNIESNYDPQDVASARLTSAISTNLSEVLEHGQTDNFRMFLHERKADRLLLLFDELRDLELKMRLGGHTGQDIAKQAALREMSEILKKHTSANNNNNNNNNSDNSEESSIVDVISKFKDVSKAKDELTQYLDEEHYSAYLRSEFYEKHKMEVLRSIDVRLCDILSVDTLVFQFMEIVDNPEDRNLLEFLVTARSFRNNATNSSPKEILQKDAVVIYEKFVGIQAASSICVSDSMRVLTEEGICSEGDEGTAECFDHIVRLTTRALEDKYLGPFLRHQGFRRYLSDLQQQQSSDASSVSSDYSIKDLRRPASVQEEPMALSEMLDPDQLWRRPQHSVINIGQIDELGRYCSLLEPLPGRNADRNSKMSISSASSLSGGGTASSKLGRAMKKLVYNEVTQPQEEFAWRVADELMREVTNVTIKGE